MGSLGKEWLRTLGGITIRKISHEKRRIANQGAGFNWGMSFEVVGGHQSSAQKADAVSLFSFLTRCLSSVTEAQFSKCSRGTDSTTIGMKL